MRVDAVTLEVARHRFAAVAEEMGGVLRRTAHSPNIKERADCSAAVFVASGEMLAQAEHIPVHLGSMPASVAAVIDRFGPDAEPGVQFAVNDPFHGGTHLNDLTLVRPVHAGSRLVGWVANRAHHADVGGEAPGSMPAHATRLEQEGHVVAPTVAVVDGRWDRSFLDGFLGATRTPKEREGDLAAQMGANETGAVRLLEAFRSQGRGFEKVTEALLDYGEARMRSALTSLPDGSFRFEDWMEMGDDDLPVGVEVTIEGDTLTADFAGSAPQVAGNLNAVEAVTRSCLYYAVRVVADPSIPANGGCYRPLRLVAPAGSIVAATPPVAVAAGNVETSQRIADVLLGALAAAAPDRVHAASQGTMNNVLVGAGATVYYETIAGGEGGGPRRPGQSGIHTGMTNTQNTPIESLETHYPFRVSRFGLRRGSGGEGLHPGGEGVVREIEFLEPATVSLMGERRRHRPWGLAGGGPGATGEDWLVRRDGRRERLPGKVTFEAASGERLLVLTPGGGGWGRRG
ncbi:MAG: hydantoinase B/oxoprolinase family protein [Acidimicrobiia bacterium]|nr:MAG: hydantoinase B/oxoprolinase family protein [Acidimicrobiia bacterium]